MTRQATRTGPCMEPLEDRLLLSTTITYTPTSITIVGDTAKTGQISVSGNLGGNYSVNVTGETPVVKGTAPTVSSKVSITVSAGNAGRNVTVVPAQAKNITVNGGTSKDTIYIGNNSAIVGNVTINGGDGANQITIGWANVTGKVAVNSGKDGDTIQIGVAADITGNATINAGDGGNGITVANATVRGKLTINGGKDTDTVNLGSGSPTQLLGNVSIDTKAGNDNIYMNQGTYGATPVGKGPTLFKIVAGGGDDTIGIGGASTPGALVFAGNFSLNAGAGNDTLGIANSSSATTVDFEKATTILMGAGNDFLQIASGHDSNNVLMIGNATIDMGASLTSGFGDRFGVSVTNTSFLTLNGSKNTINLGSGIKNLATPSPGIRANSIYLGFGTHTEIKAANGATVSSALKTAILKGLDTTADGVGVLIRLV